ncbi:hypothetical protein KKC44_06185 [Patescibacteria group bacterium]|nr:hypothetical protein [Patescibacteria group bacterium]MBU2260157.1 hypothetical protein [Patescibacteria group bacterium]
MIKHLFTAGSAIASALLTAPALAQYVPPSPEVAVSGIGGVIGGVSYLSFGAIFAGISAAFTVNAIIIGIASLVIVRAALFLIAEQSEGELAKFKTAIVSAIVAIVLVAIAQPVSNALFGGTNILASPGGAANLITDELLGIVDLIEEPIAVLAIIMIIVSGLRTVLNYGNNEGVAQLRRTVISVLIGVFFIVAKYAFVESIIESGNPDSIMNEIIGVFNWILGFVTLIAVAVIIFAGFLMIVNIGKDEQYSRAKDIIIRVAIGLLVILTAAAIANVFLV